MHFLPTYPRQDISRETAKEQDEEKEDLKRDVRIPLTL